MTTTNIFLQKTDALNKSFPQALAQLVNYVESHLQRTTSVLVFIFPFKALNRLICPELWIGAKGNVCFLNPLFRNTTFMHD